MINACRTYIKWKNQNKTFILNYIYYNNTYSHYLTIKKQKNKRSKDTYICLRSVYFTRELERFCRTLIYWKCYMSYLINALRWESFPMRWRKVKDERDVVNNYGMHPANCIYFGNDTKKKITKCLEINKFVSMKARML